ncbi:MAG TPA: MFS transporter [Candidatus Deferrimicrobium sp.]|nr:MFS transporter [Candidatus Deferrimicrobium sp.]
MISPSSTHNSETIRRLVLINSILGVTIAGASARVFMISVPTLATALDTDMLGISWALIVYQMAGIGLGVICGRLGDIHGHHKTYGIGMWVMALASLLCGFSQNIWQLILFRFLQGIGGAIIQSSGRTLAFKAMPAGSEGKAQGLMAMSHQLGFFIGPPIGGLIIDLVHWRGVFFLLFVPSLAGAALCMMTGRAAAAEPMRRQAIDYRGALLLFALTVLATLLLDQKVAQAVGTGSELLLGSVFFAALWLFLVHEKRAPSPLVDLSIFSVKVFGYGSVGLLFCNINQGLSTFITPFYLQQVLNLSPTFMGAIFLVPSLLSMVLSPVSGALTDRIGSRLLLIVGVLVLMASFIIGAYLRSDSHWLLPTILLALTGIGSAFFNTASQAAMIRALPKENWGTAIGIINGVFGLGHMLGISLSGIFLTLAFRYYTGDAGATPDPANSSLFVAAMNLTYVFALALAVIPLFTSTKIKGRE